MNALRAVKAETQTHSAGRRSWLRLGVAAAVGAAGLLGCAQGPSLGEVPSLAERPPIVFVHGNGDHAALWMATVWRFESNGWPRDRLHAIDLPYPQARDADDQPQPGRTSAAEHAAFLKSEIDQVLARTGAKQVILMGNSRGGNAIRNVAMHGGASRISHAILGGTPNQGVWRDPAWLPKNEFNGAGPVLMALNNQGAPGVELTPGPKWMTVRSDRNDKFAQPTGEWVGARGRPTHVSFSGPELRGAHNVVIAGIDHRETSYGPAAFAAAWRFLTGQEPPTLAIKPESQVMLDGRVTGQGVGNDPQRGAAPSNLPLAGASVEVYAVNAETGERLGAALVRKTVGADGRWGPLRTGPHTHLEFVVSAPGYATTHTYRTPFLRSSQWVHLRAQPMARGDEASGSVVSLTRPVGYFGIPRDRISLDGIDPAPGIPAGVAGLAASKTRIASSAPRPVVGSFNHQRLVGRTWPVAQNRVTVLELHE